MWSEMAHRMENPYPRLGFGGGFFVYVGRLSAIPRDRGHPADFLKKPFSEASRG